MIKICNDRSVFPNSVKVSNQYENDTRSIDFDLSDVQFTGNTYLICKYQGQSTFYAPLLLDSNFSIPVETFLSAQPGAYTCVIVISTVTIDENYDFSSDNPLFVSNEFTLNVDQNFLTRTATAWELTPAAQNYFDQLIALVDKVQEDLESGAFVGNGIKSITLISTVGLVDTYQILFTDNSTFDFQVTNGATPTITIENGIWFVNGISTGVSALGQKGDKGDPGVGIVSIEKTSTSGNVDTYTITFTNQTTSTFTVTNGTNGKDGVTPNIQIGTVTTLPAGSQATASITGTTENPLLNLGIPEGEQGSGGTTNYNDLENKPSINGVELKGNKTSNDLKMYTQEEVNYMLADKMDKPYVPITITDNATLNDCLAGNFKIDKIKGNTYQNIETDIVPTPTRPVPINSRKVKADDEYVELRSLKESKNLFDKNLLVANSGDTQKDSLTIQLKDKETYTISCSKNGIECILGVRATKKSDGSDSEIMLLRRTTEQGSFTVDYSTYENYIIRIYKNAYDIIDTIQLEHGSVATAYVQATVRDYKIVDHVTKTSKIVRNVGLMLVDNNSGISLYNSGGTYGFNVNIKNLLANKNHVTFCTTLQDGNNFAQKDTINCGIVDDFAYCFPSWVTKDMTVENIKDILKEKSFYVQYQLKTPTEEQIAYLEDDTSEVGYSWQDTTSPSPTIPSEIKGADKVDITVTGKNLFDFSKVKEANVLTIDYENETITIPPKTNNDGYTNSLKDVMCRYEIGKTYVMTAKTSNPTANRIIYLLNISNSIRFDEPFVLTEEILNSPFAWYNNIESETQNIISEIQIEQNNTATEYEPYTGQHITVTLPQPMYQGDVINVESEEYEYEMQKYVVTGDEEFMNDYQNQAGYYGRYFNLRNGVGLVNEKIWCNYLSYIQASWNSASEGCCQNSNRQIHIKFSNDRLGIIDNTSVEEKRTAFANYLKQLYENEKPLYVVVKVAKTTQPIPEEELAKLKSLKTGQGVNNIFIGGEIKPSIEARYPQDVVLAVNRLQNKLLTLQEEVVKNV